MGGVNPGLETISFADISAAGGPGDQWDALPSAAKLQIIGAVGFLEMWGESSVPLNLWDPVGFTKKMTPEQKEKSLLAEVNNGRLAMLGIFGLISASKGLIVPGLDSVGVAPYSGEYMAAFSSANSELPYVSDMLGFSL